VSRRSVFARLLAPKASDHYRLRNRRCLLANALFRATPGVAKSILTEGDHHTGPPRTLPLHGPVRQVHPQYGVPGERIGRARRHLGSGAAAMPNRQVLAIRTGTGRRWVFLRGIVTNRTQRGADACPKPGWWFYGGPF